MDNLLIVNTDNSLQVLQDKILYYIDAYINNLHDPNDIYKAFTFSGMLSYIADNVFKNHNKKYQSDNSSVIDCNDIATLSNVWSIYKYICGMYNKTISLQSFCLMTSICYDSVMNWKANSNDIRYKLVNTWYREEEAIVRDKAVNDNSIGSFFILKSCHNYTENNNIIITDGSAARLTAEQIASKYGSLTMPDALPELDN